MLRARGWDGTEVITGFEVITMSNFVKIDLSSMFWPKTAWDRFASTEGKRQFPGEDSFLWGGFHRELSPAFVPAESSSRISFELENSDQCFQVGHPKICYFLFFFGFSARVFNNVI